MSIPSTNQSPEDQQGQPPFGGQAPQFPQYGTPYGQAPYYGPPQPQGTSGVAIAALCTFWVPLVGLVLSIVGMVKTGAGKQRGRGLAIAALILSLLASIGYGAIGAEIGSKTSALDPGCTSGKSAIIDGSKKLESDSANLDTVKSDLQGMVSQLNTAVAASHRSDVKAAMQAMSDDYSSLLQGVNSGNLDPNIDTKIATDAQQVDHLCTFGSN